MNDEERMHLIRTMVRALDNTVDVANYPVKEGKYSNTMYRYLGIGVMNYANYLALKKIVIDTQEAAEETDALFDDLSYKIISASVELAIEKGKFPGFYETEWAKGILPIHKANTKAMGLTKREIDWDKWKELAERVKTFGIRNAQLMAIMPTATSGKAINSIESTEPVHDFFYKEEGTITIPTVVPNFRVNNKYYKRAFECDQFALLKNAAVRQKWIDQAQSINVYISTPDSLKEMTNLHIYGFKLGLKTYYYQKQQKSGDDYVCESCT
jgi:ribonucleoside-diphosphate reductase alpha chain